MRAVLKVLGRSIIVVLVLVLIWGVVFAVNSSRYRIDEEFLGTRAAALDTPGVTAVGGDYLIGQRYAPEGPARPGTVVVFGGSEGSANHRLARQLQQQGHTVLAAYYFGQPGQQEELVEVPLDFFGEVLAEVGEGPLTLIGSSKGAELAANLAARHPEVDNIVLYAPGEYTYAGLSFGGPEQFSSFTHRGEPVPFAPFPTSYPGMWSMLGRTVTGLPVSYRASYEAAAADAPAAARIDLGGFTGEGLLFAGAADTMWQSEIAAVALAEQAAGLEAVVYPDAGHVFAEDITAVHRGWEIMFGGTVEGNRAAAAAAELRLHEALSRWHAADG